MPPTMRIAATTCRGHCYEGSGHHEHMLSDETGRAVYFGTDGSGRVTSIKDWDGRQGAPHGSGEAPLVAPSVRRPERQAVNW